MVLLFFLFQKREVIDISLLIKIGADTRSFEKQIKKLTGDLGKVTEQVANIGASLTKTVTLPILALGAASIKVGADFEASMSRLGSAAGADKAGDSFKNLQETAIKMGANTKYSATEAADAMTELAKAGMDADETMSAIPGVLSMAAVENMEMADAASIVSAALNSYNMEATDAVKVSDILAKNSNKSASSVTSLGAALSPVAGFASQVGLSFTDLNAALGILSNNGLDGAIAGEKMNQILRGMAAPSKKAKDQMDALGLSFFDAEGNMKALPQVIDELNAATADMTNQQKMAALKVMFGTDAIAAILPLLRTGGDEIRNYSSALEESTGYANEAATAMNDNLKGALDEMSAAFETAGIVVFNKFADSLKTIVQAITDVVNSFTMLSPKTQDVILLFLGLLAVLGPILFIAAKVAFAIGKVQGAITLAGGVIAGITELLGGPLVVSALGAVGVFFALLAVAGLMWIYWDELKVLGKKVVEVLGDLWEASKPLVSAFANIVQEKTLAGFEKFKTVLSNVGDYFSSLGDKIVTFKDNTLAAIGTFKQNFLNGLNGIKEGVDSSFGKVEPVLSGFANAIGVIGGFVGGFVGGIVSKITDLVDGFKTLATSGDFSPLVNAIVNLLPMIIGLFLGGTVGLIYSGARLVGAIAEGMGLSVPELINKVTEIIVSAIEQFSTMLPKYIEIGSQMLTELINGFVSAIPGFINAITSVITSFTETLVTMLPVLVEAGTTLLLNLITGILAVLPELLMVGIQIITAIITAVVAMIPMILEIGITILQALIEGFITMLPILIETVISLLNTIISTFIELLPMIIDTGIQLLMALIEGIITMLPMLIEAAVSLLTSLVSCILEALPQLIDAGIQILLALIEGILAVLPQLIDAAIQLLLALAQALIGSLPLIISAGVQILMALIKGILQILSALIGAAIQLVIAIFKALIQNLPMILSAGVQLIQALIKGVLSLLGAVGSAALDIGKTILEKIKSIDLVEVGKDLITGLWNGISSMTDWVLGKISGFTSSVTDGIKDFFGIHSPSRVFRDEVGVMLVRGLSVGIEKMSNLPIKAFEGISKGLLNAAQTTLPFNMSVSGSGSMSLQTNDLASMSSNSLNSIGQTGMNTVGTPNGNQTYAMEIPVVIDGREIARATAQFTQEELNKLTTRQNRLQGIRV